MIDEMRVSFGFPLRVAVHTDVGKVRTNNEDSHGFSWLSDGSLFVIVADGMGGHEAGEVASGLAVQVLEEVMSRDLQADPRERLYHGLLEANEAILQEGRASGTRGMGTTAVATLCRGREIHVGLVGDSRLYHIRKGQLLWRTLDHTRVQMLIDQGEVPEDHARSHPESGMLTRALGHSRMADGRPLVPDVLAEPLTIGQDDALVMCSDGLHDLLEDWEIGHVIAGREPGEAAAELVRLAVERGGHDNVTVAVITAGERTADYDVSFVPKEANSASLPAPAPALPAGAPPGSPLSLPPGPLPVPLQAPLQTLPVSLPESLQPVAVADVQVEATIDGTQPFAQSFALQTMVPPPSTTAVPVPPPPAPEPPPAPAPVRPSQAVTLVPPSEFDLQPVALSAPEDAERGNLQGVRASGGLIFGVAAVTVAGVLAVGTVGLVLVLIGIWMMV